MREGKVAVNGVDLWHRVDGEGEPMVQIHGAGFGHHNFGPVSPLLARHFQVLDFDQRGYGKSDRPLQRYDMDVWADDVAGLLDALEIDRAHVHGTSMGGMVAMNFAARYPERTKTVVINSSAARVGHAGRLVFKNWADIVRIDPEALGSRLLAELLGWQCFSRTYMDGPDAEEAIAAIATIMREGNEVEVFESACQAMSEMDLTPLLPRISSPALVLGGDEDIMTPWDQGAEGVGQQGIFEAIPGATKKVIEGSGHVTIFERPEQHAELVREFCAAHEG